MANSALSDGHEALRAASHIPIAQLNQESPALGTKSIKAIVTLTWPYSSATSSVAFLLAEPNFRLRKSRGQVRVQFSGSSAKSVQRAGIASGDEVVLCLEGVEFVQDAVEGSIPGRGVEFELKFTERLVLQFRQEMSQDINLIDVNYPVPEPEVQVRIPSPDFTPSPATSIYSRNNNDQDNGWSTPSLNKRSRSSYGYSPKLEYDPFTERDGSLLGRARKRTRLSSTWRFSSRSPSPEIEEKFGQESVEEVNLPSEIYPPAIIMTDEGCQTIDLGVQDDVETQAQAVRQSTNIGTTTRKIEGEGVGTQVAIQIVEPLENGDDQIAQPPPLQTQFGSFVSTQAGSAEITSTLGPPSSPRLLPVSSDNLSMVSPLVTMKPSPFDINAPEVISPPRILSTTPIFDTVPTSIQEDLYGASPLGYEKNAANVPTSGFGRSDLGDEDKQTQELPDNPFNRWSSVNMQTEQPNSSSQNMDPYNLSVHKYNDKIGREYVAEDDEDAHFESSEFQGNSHPQAQSQYPDLVSHRVEGHDFSMSSGQPSQLLYPELGDEHEHEQSPSFTSLSYPQLPNTGQEALKQLSANESNAMSRSHSAQSAVIDLTESDRDVENLGGHEEESDVDDDREYENDNRVEVARYEDEIMGQDNDGRYERSEEGSEEDEFQREEDEIQSRRLSRGVVSLGADQEESVENSDADGESNDQVDINPIDNSSDAEEIFDEEEEVGSYDEEDASGYDEEAEGSYDEEHPEDDEFVTRRPVATAPVFVDLISDDEDEVADKAIDHTISHLESPSTEQYEEEDEDVVESEESDGELEQLKVSESDILSESEQLIAEDKDISRLSGLHATTSEIPNSSLSVQQKLSVLPVVKEPETSSDSIAMDDTSEDVPYVEVLKSSIHDSVIRSEETVHSRGKAFTTTTRENIENTEKTDLLLANEEERNIRGANYSESEAPIESVQVRPGTEVGSPDAVITTDIVDIHQSGLHTEKVQDDKRKETEENVQPTQESAVLPKVDTEVEKDSQHKLETELVAANNTIEPTFVAEDGTEETDIAMDNLVNHNFSQVGENLETPSSSRAPPPPKAMSDTYGSDGSNDSMAQEHEVASDSEHLIKDLKREYDTHLLTPADTQVNEVESSETNSKNAQKFSDERVSKEEAGQVAPPESNEKTPALPELADETAQVVANVLEPPRTPKNKASVLVSAKPEAKTRTSPRRSQRIGKPIEPTLESSDVSNQTMSLNSLKSPEAEDVDDNNELSSPIIDDRDTPTTGHDASIEMAMSALDSHSKQTYDLRRREPIVDLKLRLFRNLRTELVDYTALKLLRYHLNKKLDVLAIATTSTPDKNHQSASGLGHWHTTFNITDASIAPSGVTEIQISRPYQQALPIVHAGDGILLRNFVVHASKDRGFILRSEKNEACSWAVFKDGQDKAEMRGPPVEYDDREKNHIIAMKEWYRSLDSVAMAKLGRANANKTGATSKGAGKAS